MSSFKKKSTDLEISGPIVGSFQHTNKPIGTLNKNTPQIPSSQPPSITALKTSLSNSSSDISPSNTVISPRGNTVISPRSTTAQLTTTTTAIKSHTVTSNSKPIMSGSLQTNSSVTNNNNNNNNNTSNSANAKKTTKSTIISGKLKRFFKQRPSRDSLYEKHILAAPFGSSDLSFINIFKILTALKKSNAIETEGLFRVNGSSENIRTLWLGLNSINEPVPCTASPHDLSGLLKLYFRETKFPLIPLELFPGSVPNTTESVKDFIFSKLPDENVKILTALVDYLYQVAQKTSLNRMNPLGLGVCFAPSLVRPVNEIQNPVNISQIQSHCTFITVMIEGRMAIFNQKVETMPDLTSSPDLPPHPVDRLSTHQNEYFIPPPPSFVLDVQEGELSESQEVEEIRNINPLYDEFINLLTDDSLGPAQKSIIIERMTTLFSTDGENFKNFLRDMGIDGIISLLEYILTLE